MRLDPTMCRRLVLLISSVVLVCPAWTQEGEETSIELAEIWGNIVVKAGEKEYFEDKELLAVLLLEIRVVKIGSFLFTWKIYHKYCF
jgi:hypothetical protein